MERGKNGEFVVQSLELSLINGVFETGLELDSISDICQ